VAGRQEEQEAVRPTLKGLSHNGGKLGKEERNTLERQTLEDDTEREKREEEYEDWLFSEENCRIDGEKVEKEKNEEKMEKTKGEMRKQKDVEADKSTVESDREEEDPEDVRTPKGIRAPKGPTKKEREDHEKLHLPYRAWCRHCVRGRGRNKAHAKGDAEDPEDAERAVPRIAMDYFFMNREEERASENPMMVMIDERHGNRYMRAVDKKGLGEGTEMEWLIKDTHEELKAWGYPGGEGGKP